MEDNKKNEPKEPNEPNKPNEPNEPNGRKKLDKEKIKNGFNYICWGIKSTINQIGKMILLLFVSYLTILINILIIRGIKETSFLNILTNQSVLNSIMTSGISMLAGILIIELAKDKIKNFRIAIILTNCLLALITSLILTIQIEKKEVFFDLKLIYLFSGIFGVLTIFIVIISNFSLNKVKSDIKKSEKQLQEQRKLNEIHKKGEVNIDGSNYKL